MKKKLGWITLVILLMAIIAGASVMYNKYSQEIRDLLEQYLQQDNVSQPRRDYVRLKLFEINK